MLQGSGQSNFGRWSIPFGMVEISGAILNLWGGYIYKRTPFAQCQKNKLFRIYIYIFGGWTPTQLWTGRYLKKPMKKFLDPGTFNNPYLTMESKGPRVGWTVAHLSPISNPSSPHRLGRSVVHATSTSTGAMAVGETPRIWSGVFFTKLGKFKEVERWSGGYVSYIYSMYSMYTWNPTDLFFWRSGPLKTRPKLEPKQGSSKGSRDMCDFQEFAI